MIKFKNLYLITLSFIFTVNYNFANFIKKSGSEFNNPCINNVKINFSAIPNKIEPKKYMGAWTNNTIKWPRYTETKENKTEVEIPVLGKIKIKGAENHFQSIKRLPEHLGIGNYLVLAGGSPHQEAPGSHLFIIKMGYY